MSARRRVPRGIFDARATRIAMVLPGFALFAALVLYPIGASLRLAFYAWDGLGEPRFVAFANFAELIADRRILWALANNLAWVTLNLLAVPLGLFIALLTNQAVTGMRVIRTLFMLPFVISPVAVGLVFAWVLDSRFGMLAQLAAQAGLPPPAPLDSETWAIVAVIGAGLWPQGAYCAILYLAGLATIRAEQIDAARVDGAGGLTLLRRVVLPQLRPVTFVAVTVCIIAALRAFDLVVVMTGGGPYDSSSVLALQMYEQVFRASRFGYGAAIASVLLFMMSGLVAVGLWRLLRQERR